MSCMTTDIMNLIIVFGSVGAAWIVLYGVFLK